MLPARVTAEDVQKTWAALASIPAVRNRRVLVLRGDYLVVPGPRIAMAAEAIAGAHPTRSNELAAPVTDLSGPSTRLM